MAEPTSGADPHMAMTKLRPPQPGDKLAPTLSWRLRRRRQSDTVTIARLRPMATRSLLPRAAPERLHFILESPASEDDERFNPDQPRGLLYTKIVGPTPGYKLIGIMYMAVMGRRKRS